MWAWVQRANRLRPPQELADFHEARINACAKQFGPDGEVLGPNPEAQAAFDQEVAIADSMQADIKRTLIDLGCLTEEDVLSGSRRLEALARASAHPGIEPNSMTPSVYALACANMMRTARRFNAQDAVFARFIEWWRALAPPSGVEAHHAAVLEMYIDWREAQIVDLESLAALRAVQEGLRLPAEVMDGPPPAGAPRKRRLAGTYGWSPLPPTSRIVNCFQSICRTTNALLTAWPSLWRQSVGT